jgi:hypothetical protein
LLGKKRKIYDDGVMNCEEKKMRHSHYDLHDFITHPRTRNDSNSTPKTQTQNSTWKKGRKKNLKFHKTWRRSWVLRGRNWKKFKFTSVLSLSFAYISISFPSFFHSIVSMEQQRTTTDEEKNSLNFSPQLLF